LQAAHNVDTEEEVMDALLQYARQALDRFSSVTDSTSRVSLLQTVDNRYCALSDVIQQLATELHAVVHHSNIIALMQHFCAAEAANQESIVRSLQCALLQ
jgi:hypothetical protein